MVGFSVSSWESDGGMSPLMVVLIAVFAILLIGVIGRGLWVWNRNNHSPQQTVGAQVVTKRMKVTGYGRTTMGYVSTMHDLGSSTRTRYFATFEIEDGRRVELCVNDREFSMLAEGDQGWLSFQGTRYLGFDRAKAALV